MAGGFLSLDSGLREFGVRTIDDRSGYYRQFVDEKGGITDRGNERVRGIDLNLRVRFLFTSFE